MLWSISLIFFISCCFPLAFVMGLFQEKKDYLNCLKSSGHQSEKCRLFSKKYLQCRMEKQVD
ncbi:hypothetical protein OIU84_022996 [Salix udensis]|uniref:CHCH domain-containing protein n=1 Tax=Salix udensis TaxID=889485 RepID=A0AAD6KQ37_9ROSI|nr:hypothetical protein OIU84_022996 [Salix udensis]